jgi:hypothetical protein
VEVVMEVDQFHFLDRIGECAAKGAGFHALLHFAHIGDVLIQDWADAIAIGLGDNLALQRWFSAWSETNQRPDVENAFVGIVSVRARAVE